MTRLPLIAVALLAGAAASAATPPAEHTTQRVPDGAAAPAATSGAPVGNQAAQVGWLDRYGVYNVRQGSWMFIPRRQASWTLIPGDGC